MYLIIKIVELIVFLIYISLILYKNCKRTIFKYMFFCNLFKAFIVYGARSKELCTIRKKFEVKMCHFYSVFQSLNEIVVKRIFEGGCSSYFKCSDNLHFIMRLRIDQTICGVVYTVALKMFVFNEFQNIMMSLNTLELRIRDFFVHSQNG